MTPDPLRPSPSARRAESSGFGSPTARQDGATGLVSPPAPLAALELGRTTQAFYRTLLEVLPARSPSDRTCFQRLAGWLAGQIEAGRLPASVLAQVLLLAEGAREGRVRNPHAVFMARLRKELGYLATGAARPAGRAGKDAGCTPSEKGGHV